MTPRLVTPLCMVDETLSFMDGLLALRLPFFMLDMTLPLPSFTLPLMP